MTRQFTYVKRSGSIAQFRTLTQVMAAASLRLVTGRGPWAIKVNDSDLGRFKRRKEILNQLRNEVTKGHVGDVYRVRDDDSVVFQCREQQAALEVTDTNGNDKADLCWSAVKAEFPRVTFLGSYVCKEIVGTNTMSQHCLAGDTQVMTRDGVVEIAKLAAMGEAEVLTRDPMSASLSGRWVAVPFQSYGYDDVCEVRLSMWGRTKAIKATAAHRWFVRRGDRGKQTVHEVATSALRTGDQLVNVMPTQRLGRLLPSPFGIMAGLVFGDGHRESSLRQGTAIRLWGKDRDMLRYFPALPMTPKRLPSGVEGIEVRGLPRSYKDRPPLSESTSYLAGWLAGYIAADGHVAGRDGQLTLASVSREDLEFVRVVATRLGIATREPRQGGPGGFGYPGSRGTWVLHFIAATVPEWLILHESQRQHLVSGTHRVACWTVGEVSPAGREEVFCATVPNTGAFALSDWILTGNSYGNAVDFGAATMPDLYAIAHWLVARANTYDLEHVIVDDQIWNRGSGWSHYSGDRHYHVHEDSFPQYSGPCGVKG